MERYLPGGTVPGRGASTGISVVRYGGRIDRLNRSGKTAAIMIGLLAISLILLVIMPAESDDVVDQLVTYASIALYIAALSLIGVVVYYRRSSPVGEVSDTRGSTDPHEDFDDDISEIDREFEALEREERS
jgi:amino acid transporter